MDVDRPSSDSTAAGKRHARFTPPRKKRPGRKHTGPHLLDKLIGRDDLPLEFQREIVTPHELVKQMRASVLSAGALLARWGKARVSLPGGCAIGTRPIDIHLDALKAMGAAIEIAFGDMVLTAPAGGLC